MIIKSLKLKDFRNYQILDISFDNKTNIFYGNNAQGKTNILESIYLSGTTKSHKGSKDRDIIRFEQEECHIETVVEKDGADFQIDMHLKKNKAKGIAINKIPIKKASELFGIINIVFFSPEDLNIIKNGPSERRRFIDLELCQLDKLYFHDLSSYNKILNQRNKLLKDIYFRPDLEETLDIWDLQMVEFGKKIIRRRKKFVEELNEIIFDIHKKLSGNKEHLILKYDNNVNEEEFFEKLKENRERDLKLKSTSVGPHRDDLSFIAEDIDIRKFGSQGQQRTAALSLKLSEIELVKNIIKDTPILLLDDVLSELDQDRQNYLLDSIDNIQTLITCTGLDEFIHHRFDIHKVFKVKGGKVMNEN